MHSSATCPAAPGTTRATRRTAPISWVMVSWVATASARTVESTARRRGIKGALARGPRSAIGQVFFGLLKTDDVPLDVLQVQPPSDNLAANDLKQGGVPRSI